MSVKSTSEAEPQTGDGKPQRHRGEESFFPLIRLWRWNFRNQNAESRSPQDAGAPGRRHLRR